MSDSEAASRNRRSQWAVMSRRRRLRGKCPTSSWEHWTTEQVQLLGAKRDSELAKQLHRPVSAIHAKRWKLQIAPVSGLRRWTLEEEVLLEPVSVLAIDTSGGFWEGLRMPRKLRIEYPGAIYHVMNRGDQREDIFRDDRERFLGTLGEACAKTQWQVHARLVSGERNRP